MHNCIPISTLNDFNFCPKSIYLHGIYQSFSESTYHATPQKAGKLVHENIEQGAYSSAARYMQGTRVYSGKLCLVGKIDIYDKQNKHLIERKNKIKKIYDGQKYQLYAQYFCLLEKGCEVKKLSIHSLSDNKRYEIPLPNKKETKKFTDLIQKMHSFQVGVTSFRVNSAKCAMCIYRQLCDSAPQHAATS